MLEELKQQVYAANMELPRRGLVTYTWGNVSGIDRKAGLVVIKPSGVAYEELTPDKLVVLDLDGRKVERQPRAVYLGQGCRRGRLPRRRVGGGGQDGRFDPDHRPRHPACAPTCIGQAFYAQARTQCVLWTEKIRRTVGADARIAGPRAPLQ